MSALLQMLLFVILVYPGLIFLLIKCSKIQDEKKKWTIYCISCVLTYLLHISTFFVNLIGHHQVVIEDNYILPVLPCNVFMWLCGILMFFRDKSSFMFRRISEFCFLAGTLFGFGGCVANTAFFANPDLLNWDILKGLLSHSVMVFSCLYLYVCGYIKLKAKDSLLSLFIGFGIVVGCGLWVRAIYSSHTAINTNIMFFDPIFPAISWINIFTILGALILVYALVVLILHFITKKKENTAK